MRKIHLEAPSFPDSRLPADSLAFANSRRFEFQTCSRFVVLIAMTLLAHLCAVDVRAQGRIIVIEKDRRAVKPPTEEVKRIAGATRRAKPIEILPMDLEVGDELIGNVETVSVRVRCKNAAEYTFSGKFRVRFLPTTARACGVSFEGKAGAKMIVDATIPTSVQTGETRLASRRTKYQVRIPADISDPSGAKEVSGGAPEVRVFQHEVEVSSQPFTGVVKEGEMLATGTARPAIKKLEPEDFLQAAEILTTLDIATGEIARSEENLALFVQLRRNALTPPIDPAKQAAAVGRARFSIKQLTGSEPDPDLKPSELFDALGRAMRHADRADPVNATAKINKALKGQPYSVTYQKLLGLWQSVLQDPNNQTKSTALEEALNEYGVSDQIVLKPSEKRIVPVSFVSGCRNPIKVQATLSNLSFTRLVSPAVAVVRTGTSNWRVELGAPGLPPGAYTAEVVFECLDCLKQQCAVTKSVAQVGFFVK